MATIVAGTSVRPIPSADRTAPARTLFTYVPPGVTPLRNIMPAAEASMPVVITAARPESRDDPRGASVDAAKIDSVIGRKPSPASIAS